MAEPLTSTFDPHQDVFSKTLLGFWVYIMSDCVLFATLFITYAVLHTETFGGPTAHILFNLSTPFAETVILLLSNVLFGFAALCARRSKKSQTLSLMVLAFILGLTFVVLEVSEFIHLVQEGNSWEASAFLSSFFTLVGTHGLHVSIGLLWMLILFIQISISGFTLPTFRRLACLTLFWHFLDLIWVFIFTFVYLEGVL